MAVDVNPTVPRNLEELAGDMNVGFKQIILLALSHRLPLGQNSTAIANRFGKVSDHPQMMCSWSGLDTPHHNQQSPSKGLLKFGPS